MVSPSSGVKLTLAFAVIILVLTIVEGQYASFYERPHCQGDQFGAELSPSCQNLPRQAVAQWLLSVDTNGHCLTLYDEWDCEGREIANFNDRRCRNVYAINRNIKSFRKCSGRTNSATISG